MSRINWALTCLLSLIWAIAFLAVDYLLLYFPPLTLVLLRTSFGTIFIMLILRMAGVALPRGVKLHARLAVLGLINAALPFALLTTAQTEISGPLTSILNATLPITTLIALKVFYGQPLGKFRVAGVIAGVLGVAVMMNGAGSGTLIAILLCLCATTSYAFGALWSLRLSSQGLQPMQAAFGQIFWAAMWLLPASALVDRPWTLPMPAATVWAAVAALAASSTAVGYLIFFRVLSSAGALASSLVTLIVPVMTVLISSLFLQKLPEAQHLAGMALILAGLVLIDRARKRNAA